MTQLHKNLVIGLNWSYYDNTKAAKAAVPRPSPWIARLANEKECVQALVPTENGSKKYMAGALILAATGNSVAIFQHIDAETVWVCAASNGLPLIGFDAVLPTHDALELLQGIEDALGKISIYGDGAGAVGSVDDLIDITSNKSIKASHLFRESIAPIIIGVGVILVTCTLGGTYYYISKVQKERAEQEMIAAAQIAAAQAAEQAKKALEAHIASAQQSFNSYPSLSLTLSGWVSIFKGLPLSQDGWSPSELFCQPSDCKVTWKRNKSAPISTYTKLIGANHSLVTNEEASTTISLPSDIQRVTGLAPKSLPDYLRDFSFTTNDAYIFSYTDPSPFFTGVPDGQDLSLQKAIGGEGTFKITTKSTIDLAVAVSRIRSVGFHATDMKITAITPLRTTIGIELNGRYRVSE